MNKNIIKTSILLFVLIFTSCEDYLTYDFGDQLTLEETFSKRASTEQFLTNVYSYLPHQDDNRVPEISAMNSMIPLSDEAYCSWTAWVYYTEYNNGSWNPTSGGYLIWSYLYKGINQATVFMNNVDACPDSEISARNKEIMKAEARFVRAYDYFNLMRQYGPVYVWGDREADMAISSSDVDRHPVETCINFVVEELDKCIDILPETITDAAWYGRATKGAAMALKSRILLYAASPLYNGCDLYKGMKNYYGEYLFPQTPDPNKWETAAKAAKDVIDLGIYKLYESTEGETDFEKAMNSYMGIYFKLWNEEIILGRYWSSGDWVNNASPAIITKSGSSGYCPSLKLVDTYPMAESGRFPITGYQSNGTPIIDDKSGYVEDGFTEGWTHPLQPSYTNSDGKKEDLTIKVHNSCKGRDARFYASVLWSGMNWINTYKGVQPVTFHNGGTCGFNNTTGNYTKVGYLWRRMNDPTSNTEDGKYSYYSWPLFRLGEIYLNYAEACNEKPNRDEAEALLYINKIRSRSGLNKLEEAYPEVKGNQTLLRELIRKERMVELAFEGGGFRFYDIHRWMIADKECNGPRFGRDVRADNFEDSWKRTSEICNPQVFTPKYYFFPIPQAQLNEMINMTQNYGW